MPSDIIEENDFSFTHVLAKSRGKPCVVRADSNELRRKIWFKTEPVTREFCYRVAQIQLCTNSRDQGWASSDQDASWSYFDVAILENSEATTPKIKDGNELAWHSHHNRLAVAESSTYFGTVFDRRSGLLNDLEVC